MRRVAILVCLALSSAAIGLASAPVGANSPPPPNTKVSSYCTLLNQPLVSYGPCAKSGESVFTVDGAADDVGNSPSIRIGSDGKPVISEIDVTAHALKVVHCGNIECRPGSQTVTMVTGGGANQIDNYSSLAIGADGKPVIAYHGITGSLSVVKCNDAACSGHDETESVVDPGASVGTFPSIAVGTDGFPVIAYRDSVAHTQKVAKCNDPACAGGGETISTINDADSAGVGASIAVENDGNPVIAYKDKTLNAVRVAKCNDPACAGSDETVTTVDDDATADLGSFLSLAVGIDGFPVISYQNATISALKVAKCDDLACTTSRKVVVDDPANLVGYATSVVVDHEGDPVVSYFDGTTTALKMARCIDMACTSADISTIDDEADVVGDLTSTALGIDGTPVVAYHDSTAGSLKVARAFG